MYTSLIMLISVYFQNSIDEPVNCSTIQRNLFACLTRSWSALGSITWTNSGYLPLNLQIFLMKLVCQKVFRMTAHLFVHWNSMQKWFLWSIHWPLRGRTWWFLKFKPLAWKRCQDYVGIWAWSDNNFVLNFSTEKPLFCCVV
jgi:hypothetical protein